MLWWDSFGLAGAGWFGAGWLVYVYVCVRVRVCVRVSMYVCGRGQTVRSSLFSFQIKYFTRLSVLLLS